MFKLNKHKYSGIAELYVMLIQIDDRFYEGLRFAVGLEKLHPIFNDLSGKFWNNLQKPFRISIRYHQTNIFEPPYPPLVYKNDHSGHSILWFAYQTEARIRFHLFLCS